MESSRIAITDTDILEALREALEVPNTDPEGAYTAHELAAKSGIGIGETRVKLKELIDARLVESVRVRRIAIDGRRAIVPAYRTRAA